ncbi:soluble liver antigen/liver pancreas antigen domain-containing protein, putative [Eimeria maxima]|uniref:O-phosphoseryl-tRNA(Sec) selenium transferase n=1 Tax=Eimeria maxima TaxID=5804 RepID=U6M9T9_EIMMA|nr:soluble liver antigen/liver pancreas antigen domain-containing protein, putative [Eimeria maxima]CDJ59249.1 soluble liver antigen/liver pancreas antigen domain-containing protein, putative [Eimeria maxima]
MEEKSFNSVEDLLGPSYCRVAKAALDSQHSLVKKLLTLRRLPDKGWQCLHIEQLLLQLAAADANNMLKQCSVGEREGRIFSSLVARRHFHLAHGIGRSGDIFALQPKAVGSSLLYRLSSYLALDAIHICGSNKVSPCPFSNRNVN